MPNITGHTELVGLMAYPIRHTQSPTTHNLAYAGSRAMGPSFVCCNDGGYASQYIVPPKPQEGSQEPTPESEVLN